MYSLCFIFHACVSAKSLLLCPTLWDLMDCSLPGSCPWDSLGKNTAVGCHALLQGIFPTQGLNPHLLWTAPALQLDSLPLSHQGSPYCSIGFDHCLSCPCHYSIILNSYTVLKIPLKILGAPKSLQMVTAAMKFKDSHSLEEKLWPTCCCCWVASVVSDSVRPHRQQPTRLLRPRDSPGKNTGVGCHFLLQCMHAC